MMQRNPYGEAPIQKHPQAANPLKGNQIEEFGDITFDSMVFPAYKGITETNVSSSHVSCPKKKNSEGSKTSSGKRNSSRMTSTATSTM